MPIDAPLFSCPSGSTYFPDFSTDIGRDIEVSYLPRSRVSSSSMFSMNLTAEASDHTCQFSPTVVLPSSPTVAGAVVLPSVRLM